MSSRPRRTFATPFVLTLAALPACTVTSASPPPQQPVATTTTTTTTRDHRDDGHEPRAGEPARDHRGDNQAPPPVVVANPPPPVQSPPTHPDGAMGNAGNERPAPTRPVVIANPPRPAKPDANDVRPPSTAPVENTPPSKGQSWTLMKRGATCEAYVEISCPKGAMCNPPPPTKYTCPPNMTDTMTVKIEQRGAACWMDPPPVKCPQNAKCATPPAKKVDCPK